MSAWVGLRNRGTRTVCSSSWVGLPWNVWINFDTPVELRRCSISLVNKPLLEVFVVGEGDFFFVTLDSIRISSGSTIGFILNSVTWDDEGECCWLFAGDCLGDGRFVGVDGGGERFFVESGRFVGLCCWEDVGDERLLVVVVVVVESKWK